MASNQPYICGTALSLHCIGNAMVSKTARDCQVHLSESLQFLRHSSLCVLSFISNGIKLFCNKNKLQMKRG
jgi:hypothetical protein